jgi:hypothetical protein
MLSPVIRTLSCYDEGRLGFRRAAPTPALRPSPACPRGALKTRVAQQVVGGPGGEGHLGHQARVDPSSAALVGPRHRSKGGSSRSILRNHLASSRQAASPKPVPAFGHAKDSARYADLDGLADEVLLATVWPIDVQVIEDVTNAAGRIQPPPRMRECLPSESSMCTAWDMRFQEDAL